MNTVQGTPDNNTPLYLIDRGWQAAVTWSDGLTTCERVYCRILRPGHPVDVVVADGADWPCSLSVLDEIDDIQLVPPAAHTQGLQR